MLASGVSLDWLHTFTNNTTVLGNFYDPPILRKIPQVKKTEKNVLTGQQSDNTGSCKEMPMPDDILELPAIVALGLPSLKIVLVPLLSTEEGRNMILRGIIRILEGLFGPLPPTLAKRIKEHPLCYLKNLVVDMQKAISSMYEI